MSRPAPDPAIRPLVDVPAQCLLGTGVPHAPPSLPSSCCSKRHRAAGCSSRNPESSFQHTPPRGAHTRGPVSVGLLCGLPARASVHSAAPAHTPRGHCPRTASDRSETPIRSRPPDRRRPRRQGPHGREAGCAPWTSDGHPQASGVSVSSQVPPCLD